VIVKQLPAGDRIFWSLILFWRQSGQGSWLVHSGNPAQDWPDELNRPEIEELPLSKRSLPLKAPLGATTALKNPELGGTMVFGE
jgi:hypothetical protein